jgi:UDP-N-acetylmuramoyl-L-alanyl-D-glutamate--2,6-diaminopimelate ligase
VTAARAKTISNTIRLRDLLEGLAPVSVIDDREVGGLALDSRRVARGDVFFACAGGRTHGIRFVDQAIAAGAAAIVYEPSAEMLPARARTDIPLIPVHGLAGHLGEIAARFYRHPSNEMTVIGITGTNGKTSCCHYIAQALGAEGRPCGVIGTLGYGIYGSLRPGTHTTPDALTVQAELARMRAAGADRAAMEVSSHALSQGRVKGVSFTVAVFTNLTHDHLDYHGDLAGYGAAKKTLFEYPDLRFAVINRNDAFGRELIDSIRPPVRVVEYGLSDSARVQGGAMEVLGRIEGQTLSGLRLHVSSGWGEVDLYVPLLGRFNAENALAVLAVLLVLGVPLREAARRIETLRAVPGRMERFGGEGGRPLVIVDYAHTPDALEQVLKTLGGRPQGRLWCVFGCGGERDRAKRPLMGAAAARYADRVILTNDNPRSEDPASIIEEIRAGMPGFEPVEVIPDRAIAIRRAVEAASAEDVVLVAGKGHEEGQVIGDLKRPFSDRLQVRAALEDLP